MLAPDVVLRGDRAAVQMGGPAELRGAEAVAAMFKGRAQAARPAVVNGAPGLAVILGGRLRIVVTFEIVDDRIVGIDGIADPDRIRDFDVALLDT
jgi:RNA polymerase sigma-70 factor (ECF subfamily)